MGVSRLLDADVSDVTAQVQDMILQHITVAREVTVARSGKRQPVLERLSIEIKEGENRTDVAKDAAEQAIEIAENDAGHRTRRYVIAVFGAAIAERQPPRLSSLTVTIRTDEDDDSDSASMTRAAGRLMSDMGDRNIRLLDQQLTMMERLLPMHSQADQMGAATVAADGATKVRLTELAIAREERKEMIDLALAVMPMFAPIWTGLGNAAAAWMAAQADAKRAEAEATRANAKAPPEARTTARPRRARAGE